MRLPTRACIESRATTSRRVFCSPGRSPNRQMPRNGIPSRSPSPKGNKMKFTTAVACLSLGLAGAWAQAQTYPTKPVHMVVPFVPGGGNDLVGRVIAARLTQSLGQSFLVENRGGANGFIGAKAVADAAPDGYTILMGPSGPMAISPAIYSKMPYSPTKDFVPVTMIGDFPLILVVSASNPARSVAELVAYAKANAAQINYGSTAATVQLTSELFKLRTNTKFEE